MHMLFDGWSITINIPKRNYVYKKVIGKIFFYQWGCCVIFFRIIRNNIGYDTKL